MEERTFDNSATLGNSPNTLERVYVNGRSIDEPLLAAIDGDSDGFLNSSKNTTNGVNLVDAEYYYLSNRLGSISAILDADNQDRILEYYRYEVFGSATVLPIVDNNTDGLEDTPFDLNDNNASGATLVSSFGNTYLYTARRFDDITGLYYYRNRYYDPRSGRFITRDPIGYVDGLNLLSYVNNNVERYTDPHGLCVCNWDKETIDVKGAYRESKNPKKAGGKQKKKGAGDIGLDANTWSTEIESFKDLLTEAEDQIGKCECIDEINIYAHGWTGAIFLDKGAAETNADAVNEAKQDLKDLAALFCPDGVNIYIKACKVCSDENGKGFAQELANATGATVHCHSGIYSALGVKGDSSADVTVKPQADKVALPDTRPFCPPNSCCPISCFIADIGLTFESWFD